MINRQGTVHKYHNESNEDLIKTGIYIITSKTNGKIYIGSASIYEGLSEAHLGFGHRWRDHIHKLLNNNHANKHLQRHVNKYGIEDLKFEILEECSHEGIEGRELYWINMTNSINEGFNQCYPLTICRGITHPKYIQLDNKEIIKLYLEKNMNIKELARKFNVSPTPIKRVLLSENVETYKNFKKVNYNKVHKEYINSNESIISIANRYDIHETTLRRGFAKRELSLR